MTSSIFSYRTMLMCIVAVTSWMSLGAVAADHSRYASVPHRSSDDMFANPCKASAFSGDIALKDEEIEDYEVHLRQRRSVIARQMRGDIDLLTEQQGYIAGLAAVRKDALRELCQNNDTAISGACLSTRNDVADIKRRWNRLNVKLRDLQSETRKLEAQSLDDDMMKTPPTKTRQKRAATALKERLWEHGVVPFVIEKQFTGRIKALFYMAMKHWEENTCITFRDKEPTDVNYISFTVQNCGCCSYVGKSGKGRQGISIGKNCDKLGIVIHELGHVIGFWHEHTRPDRDNHVKIMKDHIEPGKETNFDKMTLDEIDSLGEPYDYESIMHYSRNTFAKKRYMDTILPRPKPGNSTLPEIGQRLKLSPNDIRQANKLYNCPLCGKTFQNTTGEIYHPTTRGKPERCQWRISAAYGEFVTLNITELNIPKSYSCNVDYLEVRDGQFVGAPLIGRYCGNTVPPSIQSTGSRLWLEFHSRIGHGTGFKANYEVNCGGDINRDEGSLTSPSFPADYPRDKNCVWRISVSRGYKVALKFHTFSIEEDDNCLYDYLQIRDGPDNTSTLIGQLCGFKTPEDIQTTSNVVYLKFVSDGSVQKFGFDMEFTKELDECNTSTHGCDHTCENTLGSYRCSCRVGYELLDDGKRCQAACGGELRQDSGTITSPSYPDLYPPNKRCIWQIVAPNNTRIHLNFSHMDIEGRNRDCEFDYIRVTSGVGPDTKHYGIFCGQVIPTPVTSFGNSLQIEFNSDNTFRKTGFVAHYLTDVDECAISNGGCAHVCKNTIGSYYCECHNGFALHDDKHGCKEGDCHYEIDSPEGTISSPNFPEDYPSKKKCFWQISTAPGHRIRLSFRIFKLEPHPSCTYDHVAIYNGHDVNGTRLAKLCGASMPNPVVSPSHEMLMTFYSDVSVERKGFQIEHDTVCGGNLIASARGHYFVSHPQYGDSNYNSNLDCQWIIHAARGHVVRAVFEEFQVEDEADCRYDAVEIHDGRRDVDERLGLYCGNRMPGVVMSTSRYLYIRFRTDGTVAKKGFKVSFVQTRPVTSRRQQAGRQRRHRTH